MTSSPGSALALAAARETEQLVCARGALFLVTDQHGDVAPAGARELGLFHRDTRYLSHLLLRIVDLELVHLSSVTSHDAFNQVDMMVSGLEQGLLEDPQNFLHVRRRHLVDDGLVEEIVLTNFLSHFVSLELELHFDADFADVFEVRGAKRQRRGTREEARVGSDSVEFSYIGLDGVHYTSKIVFATKPDVIAADRARFCVQLQGGGEQRLELMVIPHRGGQSNQHSPHRLRAFDEHVESVLEETRKFREISARFRCDNAILQHAFEQAVVDLHSLRVRVGSSRIVAAGIPWFCCPFGRDALLACYEALLLNPVLAQESLRVLASYQGKRYVEHTEEEPGKIFHELRFGEMARTGEIPHSPYYGSIDATPLFVILIEATFRVAGELELLQEMREPLIAALCWIDARSENGTQLVRYERKTARGLENQGWKDSRAGVSFANGHRAQPPIALCEVQGYCVDAYLRGARVLEALGERDLAARYAERGKHFCALVDEEFWLSDEGRYAFAVDGEQRKVDTIVSNIGHLLWSRVASNEHAAATANLLLSSASFSGFGVRTAASGQPVYNPLSYHNGTIWPHDNAIIARGLANYGHTEYAATIFQAMIDALHYFRDRRLPELMCGMPRNSGNLVRYPVACSPQAWASAAPFLFLQAVLGLYLDAPARRLSIHNANLPASVSWVELEDVRIGESRVSLRLGRAGKRVHVERFDVSGPPIRTEIRID